MQFLARSKKKMQDVMKSTNAPPIHKHVPYHLINQPLSDVPTPALLIDMDILEYNMRKMNELMEPFSKQVKVRPHFKANKCSELVKLQSKIHRDLMSGVCCQKLSEAESIYKGENGALPFATNDILITNEVVERVKLERIVDSVYANANRLKISLVVDNESVVRRLAAICKDKASLLNVSDDLPKIHLIIEYNVGQNRCGVNSIEELVHLANVISNDEAVKSYVHFSGIQCYQGWNQHVRAFEDRKQAVEKVNDMAREAKKALQDHNLIPDDFIVTGGGTGSFLFEAQSNVFTEVQPGSYVFMDADYNRNLTQSGKTMEEEPESTFRQSLFVLTTVMSKSSLGDRVVVDAGMKAVSLDSGVPVIKDRELRQQLTYKPGGDEHGIIVPNATDSSTTTSVLTNIEVGDQMTLIPGHCDPTVNMHDWFICVRNGIVVDVWPVVGRSCGL